jgi:ABC transporter related protein
MLLIKGLEKRFGSFKALQNFDLDIKDRALYGLVGQNGAGKTTAMKVMTGLLAFDKGEVCIDGTDIKKDIKKVKMSIGYVPDTFGIYENINIYEYMDFFASAYGLTGLSSRKRIMNLLDRVGLSAKAGFYVDSLSKGMQQRLSLARALLHDPKFLIMDEPTAGMDPGSRYSFKEMMRQLCEDGKTILLSSHILSELSELCTDIGIIDRGSMIATGKIEDIMENIASSSPIEVRILNGQSVAMEVFRRNEHVTSISLIDKTFMLGFTGSRLEESRLLYELIENEVPVLSFVREVGSLESFFMQMTNKNKEKVIAKNDY